MAEPALPLAPALRLAPGTTLGRFVLRGLLGRGGMGEVWLAETRPGGRVALKVLGAALPLTPEAAQRFERERELLGRVSHPAIVRTLGPLESDPASGVAFFPMELVLGKSLAHVLDEHGRFPVPEAVRVLREIAAALEAVHAAGIVHRDVKPSNVLVDREGRARLSDFGLARAVDESRFTATGRALGTPSYMSPEQARAEPSGPASDLYALGIVAFEILTGKPPFSAENALALLRLHTDARPRRVRELRPDVPERLDALVVKLLEKDPAARGTATGVRVELEAIHAEVMPEPLAFAARVTASIERDTVSLAASVPRETLPARPARRGRLGLALVAAALFAVVVASGHGATHDTHAPLPTTKPSPPPSPEPSRAPTATVSASPTPSSSPLPSTTPTPSPSPVTLERAAVVKLKDGRSFMGEVSALGPTSVTLRGPDGQERTFARQEIEAIELVEHR